MKDKFKKKETDYENEDGDESRKYRVAPRNKGAYERAVDRVNDPL